MIEDPYVIRFRCTDVPSLDELPAAPVATVEPEYIPEPDDWRPFGYEW